MLPFARAAELIQDIYGLTVSPGTLVSWVGEARQALQSTADLIAQCLHEDSTHALCNAHLLRELVYVQELTGQAWPKAMTNLLLNANKLCEALRQQQRTLGAADIATFTTV